MIALDALMRAVVTRLLAANGVFENRVARGAAPSGTPYPYAVMSWAGGGDDNVRKRKKTANILLQVKSVSDNPLQAMQGAGQIDTALDDAGYQDTAPTASALDVAARTNGWAICTSTAEDSVSLKEMFEEAKPLYHEGKIFRFIMEET